MRPLPDVQRPRPSLLTVCTLALALVGASLTPGLVRAEISLSIQIAPPALPVYVQPPVPGEGYIWTPGYWAWNPTDGDYYWVPGIWMRAPRVGQLWTPGYWAFSGSGYGWHIGYWGSQVGFYGGVNYGHGYTGLGYQGGRWDRNVFRYNRAASNVDVKVVHNVYNTTVINHTKITKVSYNGGKDGIPVKPTSKELTFQKAVHTAPVAEQVQHEREAVSKPSQKATGPRTTPREDATPGSQSDRQPEPRQGSKAGAGAAPDEAKPQPKAEKGERKSEPQPQPRAEPKPPQRAEPKAPREEPKAVERKAPKGGEGDPERPDGPRK